MLFFQVSTQINLFTNDCLMKEAGDLIRNLFLIVFPLQRKEKILETLEILTLDLCFQSYKIIRTPVQKFLGRDPYPLCKWKNKLISRREALIFLVPLGATNTTLILLLMLQCCSRSIVNTTVTITVKVIFLIVVQIL